MTNSMAGGRERRGSVGENPFREIPPVAELCGVVRARGASIADPWLTELVRREVESIRSEVRNGTHIARDAVTERVVAAAFALERPRLAEALNATGVIVHTNLGRAPVSQATAEAMARAAASVVPLEIEAVSNRRGGRTSEVSSLLQVLTGAEATLVVNNCAAAVLLVLSALASGREVVVSRGEAIEIGGGFRIPDVLRQSGAKLVEVGTTNRTYVRDYAAATTSDTAAYLKVHPSNFRIAGFTHAPRASELTFLAGERNVVVLEDLGSGALLDTTQFGLAPEPTLREVIESGVDVAMASGDKLLGGPQAGIIVGRASLLNAVETHPLARAVRADKVTLAGVAATLRHYLYGDAMRHIPVWRMMSAEVDALRTRAGQHAGMLLTNRIAAETLPTRATVGGGSLPGETLESWALAIRPVMGDSPDELARRLRAGGHDRALPGVFGRIEEGRVLLDLRTVLPEHDSTLVDAVLAATR